MQLLNKGLEYNLHYKHKNWIKTLATEADTTINQLNETKHIYMRQLVANNLQKNTDREATEKVKRTTLQMKHYSYEKKLINNIKTKMMQNHLIITKADKGNTLVIIHEHEYNEKVQEFISNNNFTKLSQDITNKQQKHTRSSINTCNNLIDNTTKWKYTNMSPSAPHLHGTIKLHKSNHPVRSIIDWQDSPGYKLAIFLAKILKDTIQLPYAFNVSNSINFINNLKVIPIAHNTKLCSFDIANMYTNIPTRELINIMKDILGIITHQKNRSRK
jgi:hypothetical protein